MEYKLLKTKDNSEGQLNAAISASTLSIPLKTGEGDLFPSTDNDQATSDGDETTLNSTGIAAILTAADVVEGDPIWNLTDGSSAFILTINTNNVITTKLRGGSGNTWDKDDVWVVNPCVITINKRDEDGDIIDFEKALVIENDTDILTIASGGRGYDDSTAQEWDADDYVNIFVTSIVTEEIIKAISTLSENKANDEEAVHNSGNETISGVKTFSSFPKKSGATTPSSNDQLTTKEYVDSIGGSSPQDSFELGENMTSEDLFRIIDDSGTTKIKKLYETLTQSLGSRGGISSVVVSGLTAVYDENAERVVVFYVNSSDDKGYAIVGTFDKTTETIGSWGTPVLIRASTIESNLLTKRAVYDKINKKVVIFYGDKITDNMYAKVGTIDPSDNSISFGTEEDFSVQANNNTISSVYSEFHEKILFIYSESGTSDGYIVEGTIDGTGLDLGTPYKWGGTNNINGGDIDVHQSTGIILIGYNAADLVKGYVIAGTLSGTTFTFGTKVEFVNAQQDGDVRFDQDNGRFAVLYKNASNNDLGIRIGSISGTTITLGSESLLLGERPNTWFIDFIDTGKIVIFYDSDIDNTKNYSRDGEISDSTNTIAMGTAETMDTYDHLNGKIIALKTTGRSAFFGNVSDGSNALDYYVFRSAGTLYFFNDFAGILQETGTTGQTKLGSLAGSLSVVHSGLQDDVGKKVYIQDDATIGTTETDYRIGKIVKATKINIFTNF